MIFFNKNNKINLKKIILIINSVFFILMMNFQYNNIFALQKENIDNSIKNTEIKDKQNCEINEELKTKLSIDENQLYLTYKECVIDKSDDKRYCEINEFIKTQIKPWLKYYKENLDEGDVSDECMKSIMNILRNVFLNSVDETRNKDTDHFFKLFFTS